MDCTLRNSITQRRYRVAQAITIAGALAVGSLVVGDPLDPDTRHGWWQQPVAVAQRHVESVGQAQQHRPAGFGTAVFQEAQMARRNAGQTGEVFLQLGDGDILLAIDGEPWMVDKETQPPSRISQGKLIEMMEELGPPLAERRRFEETHEGDDVTGARTSDGGLPARLGSRHADVGAGGRDRAERGAAAEPGHGLAQADPELHLDHALRLWRTVRWLRPSQVVCRAWARVHRPSLDNAPAPPVRTAPNPRWGRSTNDRRTGAPCPKHRSR